MKIALFYIKNLLACHYALFGYRETLERMGHEVIECAFPQNAVQNWDQVAAPTIEQLMECDVIFSTYHEYVQPWLEKKYTLYWWQQLMKKVPVLARFDESMDRGDLGLPQRVPMLLRWATHYSFPAAQDAEKYGGEWLPYGADTTIFNPHGYSHKFEKHIGGDRCIFCNQVLGFNDNGLCERIIGGSVADPLTRYAKALNEKKYDVAFIGTLYPKRHEYLMKLIQHIGGNTSFYTGNVVVQDLSGIAERETTERLAMNYRQIKIFFCLPPMSRLLVEKIFDIMACDTMVMYPRFPDADFQKNLTIFENEKHIVYYEYGFYANNGKQVKFYKEHPEEAQRIAQAGGELVRSKYTLEQMLQAMLTQARTVVNA